MPGVGSHCRSPRSPFLDSFCFADHPDTNPGNFLQRGRMMRRDHVVSGTGCVRSEIKRAEARDRFP